MPEEIPKPEDAVRNIIAEAIQKKGDKPSMDNALAEILNGAKVPARLYLKVIHALYQRIAAHEQTLKTFGDTLTYYHNQGVAHEGHTHAHTEQIKGFKNELDRYRTLARGEPGKDAEVDFDEVVSAVLGHLPPPQTIDKGEIIEAVLARIEKPKDGDPGKDAEVDEKRIVAAVIKAIKDGKQLDLSHVKGAQKFIKDGVAYKLEELMHGGGKNIISGFTIIPISGTIDDSNETFTATSEPGLLNINGGFYQKTGGSITWSYAAGTITLSSPVGLGGSIFGV